MALNGVYDEVRVDLVQSAAINDIIPPTLQGPRDNLVTPGQCRLRQITDINVTNVAQIRIQCEDNIRVTQMTHFPIYNLIIRF